MTNAILSKLLIQYDLNESELEVYYTGANELLLTQNTNPNEVILTRLVRVVATNKALVQRGLPSLGKIGIHHTNNENSLMNDNNSTTIETKKNMNEETSYNSYNKDQIDDTSTTTSTNSDNILTPNERRILEHHGGGGLVVGIPLGYPFYWRCIAKCRSKRSRKLAKENPNAFKLFILRYIKGLAKEELRRESLGLTRISNTVKYLHHIQKQEELKTHP